jgi:hypothetical protein
MKAGYNPLRRNRNIGTSKQGHGRNNQQTIPLLCHAERDWWENLGSHYILKKTISSVDFDFVVEETREGYIHACTVEDVCHLLSLLPPSDLSSLQTFVFRQSTRKQWSISPAWGRLAYFSDLGSAGKRTRRRGPAIFLEAINPEETWKWGKDIGPAELLEVERLKHDGHIVEETARCFLFRSSPTSIRATQLYRTLLHEIGHWVDWLEKVERPATGASIPYETLSDRYFARPYVERERFAHRYARTMRERLTKTKRIPFDIAINREETVRG